MRSMEKGQRMFGGAVMGVTVCRDFVASPDNSAVGALPTFTRVFKPHVSIHECVELGAKHIALCEPAGSHVPGV